MSESIAATLDNSLCLLNKERLIISDYLTLTECLLWIKYNLATSCQCLCMSIWQIHQPFLKAFWCSVAGWLGVPQEIQDCSSDKSLLMPCPRISTAYPMCGTSTDRNPLQSKRYPNINTLLHFLILFFWSRTYKLLFALGSALWNIALPLAPDLILHKYLHTFVLCKAWFKQPLLDNWGGASVIQPFGPGVERQPACVHGGSLLIQPASPRNHPRSHQSSCHLSEQLNLLSTQ